VLSEKGGKYLQDLNVKIILIDIQILSFDSTLSNLPHPSKYHYTIIHSTHGRLESDRAMTKHSETQNID
jgi:hypothetical protein